MHYYSVCLHAWYVYMGALWRIYKSIYSKSGILSFPLYVDPGTDLVKLLGLHVSLPIEPSCWPNYNNFPAPLFPIVLYSGGRTPFNLFPLVNKSLDRFLMIYGSLNF